MPTMLWAFCHYIKCLWASRFNNITDNRNQCQDKNEHKNDRPDNEDGKIFIDSYVEVSKMINVLVLDI